MLAAADAAMHSSARIRLRLSAIVGYRPAGAPSLSTAGCFSLARIWRSIERLTSLSSMMTTVALAG